MRSIFEEVSEKISHSGAYIIIWMTPKVVAQKEKAKVDSSIWPSRIYTNEFLNSF